jgi:Pirin-related protein
MESVIDIIEGRPRDLGGFSVRRVLPAARRRTVGPFIFFDHLGPADFAPGSGMDVRPHPHIGLATVTYLLEGRIVHRDSLGNVQAIEPGAVNWMTAGRGIVHSERTADEDRVRGLRMHGLQFWVWLPRAQEECAPAFHHYPAASLPQAVVDGVQLRLIAGTAIGLQSPVQTLAQTLYVDARLPAGGTLQVPAESVERALYPVDAPIEVDGRLFEPGRLLVLAPGRAVRVHAERAATVMLLGGEPLDGERQLWWNFVSSSPERIEQARADWAAGRFPAVPGEHEFIPLPER